jgi:hypothetical protein
MPPVKFFARLDLDSIGLFLDGHYGLTVHEKLFQIFISVNDLILPESCTSRRLSSAKHVTFFFCSSHLPIFCASVSPRSPLSAPSSQLSPLSPTAYIARFLCCPSLRSLRLCERLKSSFELWFCGSARGLLLF